MAGIIDTHIILPQQPPFIMVDDLLFANETFARTQFTINKTYLFVQNDKFQIGGLVENMAQTCAAKIGYIAWLKKQPVRIGVIGSIKNMNIHFLPETGAVLTTEISVKAEVFDLSLIEAKVMCGDKTVAEGELKVALMPQ